MPPSDLTIKVELKQHSIGLAIWKLVVTLLGVRSSIARRTWSCFQPLEINIEGRGWERINIYRNEETDYGEKILPV